MKELFKNKKILITGHTGFKGSWLAEWMKLMDAKVFGISLPPLTTPSHYNLLSLNKKTDSNFIDIKNYLKLKTKINEIEPDYVFHLAAQPIVKEAYENPLETFNSNAIGTLNILEALKDLNKNCIAILVTSDKCYQNVEWIWGYKETDRLGGSDPYSASKAAAEIIIKSYVDSFFSKKGEY